MNFSRFKTLFEKKEVLEYPNTCSTHPLVSICVQTYNQNYYIKNCLESILNQNTDFEYEILLGDDNSSDGTREICLKYAQKYPDKIRLFLHHRENNISIKGKPTGIFNSLFNIYSSKAEFIAYCDGDDLWNDTHKLQKQVKYLSKHQETVLTYHKVNLINEEGVSIPTNQYIKSSERNFSAADLKKAIIQPPISTWCFRNVISDIPIEFTRSLNGDNFWISLLGNYGNGKFLKNIKPTDYRIHSNAMWSTIEKPLQLSSKFNTYLQLSRYYGRKGENNLAKTFNLRANGFAKMILNYHLKRIQIGKAIHFLLLYLKS